MKESADTQDAFALARSCLAECVASHNHQPSVKSSFTPTRLLKASETNGIFQVVTVQPDQNVSYVVLSYCWGGDQVLKLTTNSLNKDGERQLQYDTLPQTIQDAVKATVLLGYEYLWVDSMCKSTLQDPPRCLS